jgi:ureidoacrylate peracid hydrolase
MSSLRDQTIRWLKEIAPYNIRRFPLSKESCALLIIDMQNYFVAESGGMFVPATHEILDNIKALQKAFRDIRQPVIFTSHSHYSPELDGGNLTWWWDGYCRAGSPDADIYDDIKPLEGEKIVHKHRYSGFEGTDLQITLHSLGITDLVITGTMTNLCCETTARDAFNTDYRVQFVCDAVATSNDDLHLATLKNISFGFAPIVTTNEVIEQLT